MRGLRSYEGGLRAISVAMVQMKLEYVTANCSESRSLPNLQKQQGVEGKSSTTMLHGSNTSAGALQNLQLSIMWNQVLEGMISTRVKGSLVGMEHPTRDCLMDLPPKSTSKAAAAKVCTRHEQLPTSLCKASSQPLRNDSLNSSANSLPMFLFALWAPCAHPHVR